MQIVVEVFRNKGEPSTRKVRVRPVPGQTIAGRRLPDGYRVWCSVTERSGFAEGSLFMVDVSVVQLPFGRSYLRIGLNAVWRPMTAEQVRQYLGDQSRST